MQAKHESESTEEKLCTEDGCPRTVVAKGLCATHYMRVRRKAKRTGSVRPHSGEEHMVQLQGMRFRPAVAAFVESYAALGNKTVYELIQEIVNGWVDERISPRGQGLNKG